MDDILSVIRGLETPVPRGESEIKSHLLVIYGVIFLQVCLSRWDIEEKFGLPVLVRGYFKCRSGGGH